MGSSFDIFSHIQLIVNVQKKINFYLMFYIVMPCLEGGEKNGKTLTS